MGQPVSEVLERWSARELQELHALSAVQAEERGDLPPPPPDDDEPDPDDVTEDPTDDEIEAMVKAEQDRISKLTQDNG